MGLELGVSGLCVVFARRFGADVFKVAGTNVVSRFIGDCDNSCIYCHLVRHCAGNRCLDDSLPEAKQRAIGDCCDERLYGSDVPFADAGDIQSSAVWRRLWCPDAHRMFRWRLLRYVLAKIWACAVPAERRGSRFTSVSDFIAGSVPP